MPRAKKDTSLQNIGKIDSSRSINTITGLNLSSSLNTLSGQQIESTSSKYINIIKILIFNIEKSKLSFKKPNFASKFRSKEKNARVAKNIKNMVQDTLDSLSYNMCKN